MLKTQFTFNTLKRNRLYCCIIMLACLGWLCAGENIISANPPTIFKSPVSPVNTVTYTSDGNALIVGSPYQKIKKLDINTGLFQNLLQGPLSAVSTMAHSPDGTTLAIAGGDTTIKIWNVETGQLKHILAGHTDEIHSIAYAPDGVLLASASHDNTIRTWNTKQGKTVQTFTEHTNPVKSVIFSPDGDMIASVSEKALIVREIKDGEVRISLAEDMQRLSLVTYSPNGEILTLAKERTILLLDASTGKQQQRFEHDGQVISLTYSPDGKILASSTSRMITLWDIKTGKRIINLQPSEFIKSLLYSPDGKMIASLYADSTIQLWEVTTKELERLIKSNLQERIKELERYASNELTQLQEYINMADYELLSLLKEDENPKLIQWLEKLQKLERERKLEALTHLQLPEEKNDSDPNILNRFGARYQFSIEWIEQCAIIKETYLPKLNEFSGLIQKKIEISNQQILHNEFEILEAQLTESIQKLTSLFEAKLIWRSRYQITKERTYAEKHSRMQYDGLRKIEEEREYNVRLQKKEYYELREILKKASPSKRLQQSNEDLRIILDKQLEQQHVQPEISLTPMVETPTVLPTVSPTVSPENEIDVIISTPKLQPLPHSGLFIRRNNEFGTKQTIGIKDLIEQGMIIDQTQIRFDDFVVSYVDNVPQPSSDNAVAISYGLSSIPSPQVRDKRATHYLELALRASDTAPISHPKIEGPPVNYIFVIDTSSSMSGEKIETVKASLRELFQNMREDDVIGIIKFNSQPGTLLEATPVGKLAMSDFSKIISNLRAFGSTNLNMGVLYGISEVFRYEQPTSLNHIFLFSDGNPTSGETDWLEIRKNIMAELRGNIRLSTFAYGSDANTKELDALAGMAGGKYTFVAHPEDIQWSLEEELSRRQHLAAINIQLNIEIEEDVSILYLYGHDQVTEPARKAEVLRNVEAAQKVAKQIVGVESQPDIVTQEKGIRIFVPDLAVGETYYIVFELVIPQEKTQDSVGKATVQYVDTFTRTNQKHELTLSPDGNLPSDVVAQHALGLWTSEVAFLALDDLYEKDLKNAEERIEQHISLLGMINSDLRSRYLADDIVILKKFVSLARNLGRMQATTDPSFTPRSGGLMTFVTYALNQFGRVRGGVKRIKFYGTFYSIDENK